MTKEDALVLLGWGEMENGGGWVPPEFLEGAIPDAIMPLSVDDAYSVAVISRFTRLNEGQYQHEDN